MANEETTNAAAAVPATTAPDATPAAAPATTPTSAPAAEETPAAAAEEKATEEKPAPAAPETSLEKLIARLPGILTKVEHTEMWGVELPSDASTVPSKVILQKFLRANNGDLEAAEKQLTSALEWRKKLDPNSLLTQSFDAKKFKDLGFVTTHKGAEDKETVITWNIYGAVKDRKVTFGNVDEFIRWRAALMELSIRKLGLDKVTALIPDDGPDPYQMVQVHDYKSLSFFRLDAETKAASKETIRVMGMAYPELLSEKFFVNVPAIMGWVYGAMKLFLAPATLKKFHPMSSGTTLATELTGIAKTLPKDYGGEGSPISEGSTIALTEVEEQEEPEAKTEETQAEETKAEETKMEETKMEETKTEETKTEETKTEETKTEETKTEEAKPAEEVKNVSEAKADPSPAVVAAEPKKEAA